MRVLKEQFDIKIFITLILYTAILFWLTYAVYALDHVIIYAENGLLENMQVITLFIAMLVFLQPLYRQKREDKLVLLFFALLCLSFILREVDVEKLNIPELFILLGSGVGRNVIMASGFIAIIGYALFHFNYYKALAKHYIFSKKGFLLFLAALLLLSSDYFEHQENILHHVFLEEIIELSGYVLILLTAFLFSRQTDTEYDDIKKLTKAL